MDGVAVDRTEVEIVGATQDSRAVESGQLFVPLVAERDGHDFIAGALEAGAAAYITQRQASTGVAIEVADTMFALSSAGRFARAKLTGPVVGITGSVGKTSAKDLLAGALSTSRVTHASTKSFNNEIGVPLTLLNAPDDAEAVVLEMGARGIGHIQTLCDVAAPTIGIVTTVAGAHVGEFGSIENIAQGKGELVEGLPDNGLAVLNADNPYVSSMATRTAAEVLTFGVAQQTTSGSADVVVSGIALDEELRGTFTIDSSWGRVVARPQARGAHMAINVAAAVAAALWLGDPIVAIEEGIAKASTSPWRMEVFTNSTGLTVINDSYNANPTSMRGAIESLVHLDADRKVAIVGYMGELGEAEGEAHRAIARLLDSHGIEIVAVGTDLYGIEPSVDALAQLAGAGEKTAVLVKGSRSAGLEALADKLR